MEKIRKQLIKLLRVNRVTEILVDSNYQYISFETYNGAQYTFIPAKGNCTYSNKCSSDVIKIYGGLIKYVSDINTLEDFYIDEYCEECILESLDYDNFEQYENFGME